MSRTDKIPLLVLSGPTAGGKTALSVALARQLGAQIICADSMQVYQDLYIGTARPTPEEMGEVPHHLFGILPLQQAFSVAAYAALAHQTIRQVAKAGALPLLCGGTGLYIQAVTENITYTPQPSDPVVRTALLQEWQRQGPDAMLEQLRQVDPETAARLHRNDRTRIIRALEIYRTTGITQARQNQLSRQNPSPYDVCHITLDYRDRQILYDRSDRRVEEMMRQGLEREARAFFAVPDASTAAQAIGYKELRAYFDGEISREQAVARLKQATRRYAKRQLCWFRHMPGVRTLYCDDYAAPEALTQAALDLVGFDT